MRVLLLERNLMWSSKLTQSLRGLSHEVVSEASVESGDVAIVNLSDPGAIGAIDDLRNKGLRVIGHAGHKETALHEAGAQAGDDLMVTNSELTFKLEEILQRAGKKEEGPFAPPK
jgi:hypothetical protein